jgi:hypothetical protein
VSQFSEQQAAHDGAAQAPRPGMAILLGDGQFAMKAVGTAEHQHELAQIAGGRTEQGADHLCGALLIPDPKNPYDPGAVAVVIASHVIGYLATNAAPSLKQALRAGGFIAAGCAARIVGGWEREDGDTGHFGVRLDAAQPFNLRPIAKETAKPPPVLAARDDPPPMAPEIPAPLARYNPAPAGRGPYAPAPKILPPIAHRAPVEQEAEYEPVTIPRSRRSIVSIVLQLLLIAALLAAGAWWVQRLPREPQDVTPAAAPPPVAAEPEQAPQTAPPEWPVTPPSAPPAWPTTEPPSAPTAVPPPRPAAKPAPKAPAKKKAAPKAEPPNAPLKIN